MGTRASPAWCVECGAKRDCPRLRQHPKGARTEKSGEVLTLGRQYFVGTTCWVYLSWCPPCDGDEGGGTATCTVATSWFSTDLAASGQRNGMKEQRKSFAFKSSPGLSRVFRQLFPSGKQPPAFVWAPRTQHKSQERGGPALSCPKPGPCTAAVVLQSTRKAH